MISIPVDIHTDVLIIALACTSTYNIMGMRPAAYGGQKSYLFVFKC